jgi:hypothetical protein
MATGYHEQQLQYPAGAAWTRRESHFPRAPRHQGVAPIQTDVGGGKLIAWLEDADGNLIGLQQTPG